MKYEVKYKPAYSLLVVSLNPGESIAVKGGSMTYMQPTLEVRTRKREKGFHAAFFCQCNRKSIYEKKIREKDHGGKNEMRVL